MKCLAIRPPNSGRMPIRLECGWALRDTPLVISRRNRGCRNESRIRRAEGKEMIGQDSYSDIMKLFSGELDVTEWPASDAGAVPVCACAGGRHLGARDVPHADGTRDAARPQSRHGSPAQHGSGRR